MTRGSTAVRRWFRSLAAALLGIWALGLGGCATAVYDVKVSGLARGEGAKPASFRLVPFVGAPADKSPARDAANEIVQRALTNKGFRAAPAGATSDLFIVISCGLTNGSDHLVTTGTPIYVMASGGTHEEQRQVGMSSNGTPIYVTVTVRDPPTPQLTGYDYQTSKVTALKKYLRVFAFDRDPIAGMTDEERQHALVWAVQAVFESDDNNLSKLLPVLTAAGMAFVGQATNGPVPIRMQASDRDVASLR